MSRTPPDRAIYFLDENVDGPLLADTLRADGFEIRQLRDCFARGAEDEARARLENYIAKCTRLCVQYR